jgi:hypothetical protein
MKCFAPYSLQFLELNFDADILSLRVLDTIYRGCVDELFGVIVKLNTTVATSTGSIF